MEIPLYNAHISNMTEKTLVHKYISTDAYITYSHHFSTIEYIDKEARHMPKKHKSLKWGKVDPVAIDEFFNWLENVRVLTQQGVDSYDELIDRIDRLEDNKYEQDKK